MRMLTIQIKDEFVFQLHKNHVSQALIGNEELIFTENLTGSQVAIRFHGFKELQNCYLLTMDSSLLSNSDINNELRIVTSDNMVVYRSEVILVFLDNEQL